MFISLSSNTTLLIDSVVMVPQEFITGDGVDVSPSALSECDLSTRFAALCLSLFVFSANF